ncbi:MAG: nitroreductase family protein [Nitrospiraceae bacterium]|nr:MAG: nitroreductase family protein [Nitrospiraceae bacterium]
MDIFEIIKTRRSIRRFTEGPVADEVINKIIEAGTWAPSGMNNQPWKFAVIKGKDLKTEISGLTHYSEIVLSANVLIAVFLDNSLSYDRTKDCQAIGACIQNMLLTIHSLGLGAVWLGEILKSKDKILELTGGPQHLELMAVIALGYPAQKGGRGSRKGLEQVVFARK